jgi:N-acetylglutamate synthase-like GNAT family acetyltransferase
MLSTAECQFYLRPFGEENVEQDYALLHTLSNFQVPQDPKGNLEWQYNRRAYDESKRTRRHYIAHEQSTGQPIAYAAIEQQENNSTVYRLFLVFNPDEWTFSEIGTFLYQHLLRDARAMGATSLVLVEYADDFRFLKFLSEHGFIEAGKSVFNGFSIVRVEKRL